MSASSLLDSWSKKLAKPISTKTTPEATNKPNDNNNPSSTNAPELKAEEDSIENRIKNLRVASGKEDKLKAFLSSNTESKSNPMIEAETDLTDEQQEQELVNAAIESVALEEKHSAALDISDQKILEERIRKLATGNAPLKTDLKTLSAFKEEPSAGDPKSLNFFKEDKDGKEEEPMCSFCDLDATKKCLDEECEGDVFCNNCWNYAHGKEALDQSFQSHKFKSIT